MVVHPWIKGTAAKFQNRLHSIAMTKLHFISKTFLAFHSILLLAVVGFAQTKIPSPRDPVIATTESISADRVLVVENADSPASVEITKYYMTKRGVKKKLSVHCQDSAVAANKETMAFKDFQNQIEEPLRKFLASNTDIDFIVLTKGVPIRLTDAPLGISGSRCSLDSFIAALDYSERKDVVPLQLKDTAFTGKCYANRFWNSQKRFTHADFGGYLVTRLDGYTVDDAKSLVDRAIAAESKKPTGNILIDIAAGFGVGDISAVPFSPVKDSKPALQVINEMGYKQWNADLAAAVKSLESAGKPVILEDTEKFAGKQTTLMGYGSWGSNDPKFVAADYKGLVFSPGGIAETAVSTSGRTFLPTSGGQSLVADLIVNGVTGVKGYCNEPLLLAIASPSILFDRYTTGWTLAESFYAASRFVGWEDIVIGDPLCAPYR